MKKKRILCVLYDNFALGGVQSLFLNIVGNLYTEYQFDFVVFEISTQTCEKQAYIYGCRVFYIPHYNGSVKLRKRADYYLRGYYIYTNVKKMLKRYGPYDVIHCNKAFESGLCVKAAYECGIPIRIVHSHTNFKKSPFPRVLWDKYYQKMIKKYSTCNIGCSKEACKSLFENLNCQVINNPYDEKKYFYRELNKIGNKIVLTQVGSFSENKNQIFSVLVLKEILALGQDAELRLVGFDPVEYKKKIVEKVGSLHLEKQVVLLPGQISIPDVLEDTNACIFPSHNEGFGIVIIEAQAVGIHCYISDTIPEAVNVGGVTFLALKAGAASWAKRIVQDYKESKGHHKKFDCSAFSSMTIAEEYKKLYKNSR